VAAEVAATTSKKIKKMAGPGLRPNLIEGGGAPGPESKIIPQQVRVVKHIALVMS
jgi:hypothetical protein